MFKSSKKKQKYPPHGLTMQLSICGFEVAKRLGIYMMAMKVPQGNHRGEMSNQLLTGGSL